MYVARDKDGTICLYTSPPIKGEEYGRWYPSLKAIDCCIIDEEYFPEVKWEDKEPTEIKLIKK